MVFHFQGIGDIVQFRVRATPTHFNNFTLGRIEKLLRIDLPEKKTNDQYCQGEVEGVSAESSIALSLDQICPNCTNFFSSYNITFHESNNTSITSSIVPVNFFDPQGLNIRVNPQNDSNSVASTCNEFDCQTRGFNCCLNNQCVVDGAENLMPIKNLIIFNLKLILKMIHSILKTTPIYFIFVRKTLELSNDDNTTTAGECSDSQYDTQQECEQAGETFTSASEVALNTFEIHKKEYFCLEGAKQNDYASERAATPPT